MINVNQARPTKRARAGARDWGALARKVAKTSEKKMEKEVEKAVEVDGLKEGEEESDDDEVEEEVVGKGASLLPKDPYTAHWAHDTPLVANKTKEELEALKFRKSAKGIHSLPGLGRVSELIPAVPGEVEVEGPVAGEGMGIYNARLIEKLKSTSETSSITPRQSSLLTTLSSYKDFYHPLVRGKVEHEELRAGIALHAMNHVLKSRAKILKNNDHISRSQSLPSTSAPLPARNTADQGFTRPKVLILLPFRNSAQTWVSLLSTLSLADTIENKSRFDSEYSLPEGAVDKLIENKEGNYKEDHVDLFKGNIDDSFRLGVKVTRKTVKLFSEFYSCDIVLASPLGLRMSLEKEKDSDFLSSIEVLIVDQMDVMLMQNWDHVQFILDRMNKLPEEAHGCDFSRVKPWYLDGKSIHLRQSILLSSYETPELRSLYTKSLHNVSGKLRVELPAKGEEGVMMDVPKGVKQVFTRFEAGEVWEEDDKRFEWFTQKTLPMLRKSAVSSSQTIIFVPSYFDFVRLKRYMKKLDDFSFVSISEYSPTPDISRARGAFFAGKKSFLLVTERFHFFRRYRIRGAKTYVFYAPPDHSHYYPEILSFPFPKLGTDELQPDESELSAQVLFSKFDLLRLERLCGSEEARKMVGSGQDATRFTFLE